MADSMCFEKQTCPKVEEDWADRYRNNTQELDDWFYAAYYMDPQPQFDPSRWATPEDDDDILDVGEPSQIPKKFNGNSKITCAATSSAIINKCVGGKVKELKDLSEFICITMGLGPVCESKKLIKPPIAKKVVPTAPVKKVVSVLPSTTKRDEQKVTLNNKRKMSHCDFIEFEATTQMFHDDHIKDGKKQKTDQVLQIQKSLEQLALSKPKPTRKSSFTQKLMAMANHSKKHHNFQSLVY